MAAVGLSLAGIIDFSLADAAAIGIIGGADGPTAIFVASKLAPELLGAIAVAAYSYMALVPMIQPPIMRALTTQAERNLFEALRIKRQQLAKEQSVPPYVVFHDATLKEMVHRQPASLEQIAGINGVGTKKLDAYGRIFLAVIQDHTHQARDTTGLEAGA